MAVLKIARLWPSSKRRPVPQAADTVGLDAFSPEAGNAVASPVAAFPVSQKPAPPAPRPRSGRGIWLSVAAFGLVAAAGVGGYYLKKHPVAWPASPGSITFETAPAGIDVSVAGRNVGRTPVTVSLAPGSYDVKLGTGASARAFALTVASGTSVVQHYEMAPAPVPAAPVNGSLRVQTEPAHQAILVDGVERGASPLALEDVAAGDHEIAIRAEHGAIKRSVHVTAGQTTSVILTAAASPSNEGPVVTAGWLSVAAPIALQVREGGRLVGSTDVEKLMMSSGDHTVELANETFGFRAQRTVKIAAGKTAALKIDLPNGTVSLNAVPWADVYVDGERVGQTPIGNLSRPIGRHEVIFRHPTLGERREFVNITTQQPARLGVDFRK